MKLSNASIPTLKREIKRREEKYIRDHRIRVILESLSDDDLGFIDTLIRRHPKYLKFQVRNQLKCREHSNVKHDEVINNEVI